MQTTLTTGMASFFWAALGFMAGIAAAFFIVQLWRGSATHAADGSLQSTTATRSNRTLVLSGVIAVFFVISFVVYAWVGSPGISSGASTAVDSTEAPPHALDSAAAPGSMADVTNQLAAKLAAGKGSDADWQLLQQSYEFLGDAAAAALANDHQLKPGINAAPGAASDSNAAAPQANSQVALLAYQQRVATKPDDVAAWLAIAQLQRAARHFPEAEAAFANVIKLKRMDADAWADYADVTASLHGSLADKTARAAIDAALKLNGKHAKALWLKASLAMEEKRYGDALQTWQTLRAVLPDKSADVTIIDANIAEAQQLSSGKQPSGATQRSSATQPGASSAEIHGVVVLDPAIARQVTAGMTLFIYAKADDSPAPVAAYRGAVTTWPVSFALDDSNAMMPMRKLSQYQQVKLEARLTSSGQALAQSGDLQADAIMVETHSGKAVTLKITRQVP